MAHLARSFAFLAATALGGVSLVGCSHGGHSAGASQPLRHTITVVGHGEVQARPDIVRANLGVEVLAPTVAEANRLANERASAIMAALASQGVAAKDIQTSNYSISFERQHPEMPMPMPTPEPPSSPKGAPPVPPGRPLPPPPPSARAGFYRVSNNVEVTIRDIAKAGPVLDAAVAAGANQVYGVHFAIDETEPFEAKVREEAVADARKKALVLARLHKKTLGEVLAVSEVVGGGPRPFHGATGMAAEMRDAGNAQLAPGELTLTGQVEVVYAFEE